ncbi:MAG: hypothetical protein D6690_02160 [Nitrospirae bacterium]|nr:MAG: hypothetical protein D6690_02160 [Nitrospirota bacterium]
MRCLALLWCVLVGLISSSLANTQTPPETPTPSQTRTIVADLLMIDGDFYVVRGERGEIRIEVTPRTTVTEEFTFGDRIKAVVLPNDKAISIERAGPNDPVGITVNAPPAPTTPPLKQEARPAQTKAQEDAALAPIPEEKTPRIIVADLLMVDGDFYVVRGERGEIRIEVTPETELTETFKFGDRIKAAVLPNDKALWIKRATPDDQPGVYTQKPPSRTAQPSSPQGSNAQAKRSKEASSASSLAHQHGIRTIVADLLMVDGDFYVVRGERGEIRIEITPETKLTDTFTFGDRIKAKVLPNDKAISIERAKPNDPIGVFEAK